MQFRTLIAMAAISLTLTGCGDRYTIGGKPYGSAQEAFAAQDRDFQQYKSQVQVSELRFTGKALVITPDKSLISETATNKSPNARADLIDYVATAYERDLATYAELLRIAQVFTSVESRLSPSPEHNARLLAEHYDVVIYPLLDSPATFSWFMITSHSDKPRLITPGLRDPSGIAQPNVWTSTIAQNYKAAIEAKPSVISAPADKAATKGPAASGQDNPYDQCMQRILRIQDVTLRTQSLSTCDSLSR